MACSASPGFLQENHRRHSVPSCPHPCSVSFSFRSCSPCKQEQFFGEEQTNKADSWFKHKAQYQIGSGCQQSYRKQVSKAVTISRGFPLFPSPLRHYLLLESFIQSVMLQSGTAAGLGPRLSEEMKIKAVSRPHAHKQIQSA